MPDTPKIPIDSEELLQLGLTPKQLVFMANCMTCVINLAMVNGDDVSAMVNVSKLLMDVQAQAHAIGQAQFLAMHARIRALVRTTDVPITSPQDAFPDGSQN